MTWAVSGLLTAGEIQAFLDTYNGAYTVCTVSITESSANGGRFIVVVGYR